MNDEQKILLGPEEELTSVRERLNNAQARRIILVIPAQTQLRSHVGWRLIHARMRELGKEVLVVSPDQQIRAIAKAVGFQVAESQEAPSTRPRLGSTKPGAINTRSAGRSHIGRKDPESQVPQQQPGIRRRFTPNTASKPLPRQSFPERFDDEDEETFESPQKGAGSFKNPPGPSLEKPGQRFGPAHDFKIQATSSVRPSVPQRDWDDDEEFQNDYEDDYYTAQSILQAAREGSKPSGGEIEADISDISEKPTVEMENEIEDLGDMGNIELPEIRSSQTPSKLAGRQREQEGRPRRASEPLKPSTHHSPRAPRPELDDDEELLPPDKPTRGASTSPRSSRELAGQNQRSSQTLKPGTGQRSSQTLTPGSGKRVSQPIAPGQAQRALQPVRTSAPAPSGTGSQKPPIATIRQQSMRPRAPRRSHRGIVLISTALLLLLLISGILFYFVPTARVIITLHASTSTQTVHLNATSDPQANVPNRAPAQLLTHDFSVNGQGKASGTTKVGNARAQGFVTFTNNGNADVTIPSGTLIATLNGTQFVTGAEAVVLHGSTQPAVPISAQQPGEIGNVAANSISVIPPDSLASIARRSGLDPATITAKTLTVTNEKDTGGGGATSAPQVTRPDLQIVATRLHKQLQQAVQTWLDQQIQSGDVRGKLVPDVLASTTLLKEEQVSATPPVGQPTSPSGAFTGTLTLHISILVARKADLQAAAAKLLNAAALQMHPAQMLATRLPVSLNHIQSTPAPDGKTLAITADASGALIPQIDLAALASSLTNKWVDQAKNDLKNGVGDPNLKGIVQNVQIEIQPAFLSILPMRVGNIQITLDPRQEAAPQHLQNGL